MAQINVNLDTELLQEIFTGNSRNKGFSKLMEVLLNQVLEHQATEQLGAKPYERTDSRQAYRGSRSKAALIGKV